MGLALDRPVARAAFRNAFPLPSVEFKLYASENTGQCNNRWVTEVSGSYPVGHQII